MIQLFFPGLNGQGLHEDPFVQRLRVGHEDLAPGPRAARPGLPEDRRLRTGLGRCGAGAGEA